MSVRVVELSDARAVDLGPEVLGGKGAGLVVMSRLGLRVPPGFVVTTEAGRDFLRYRRLRADVRAAIRSAVGGLEDRTARRLGDQDAPLLVSVRSGSVVSMPGMMSTVLDVGAPDPDEVRGDGPGLAFALDTRRRFVRGFAATVLGLDEQRFAGLDELWRAGATSGDTDRLLRVLRGFEQVVRDAGGAIPDDPVEQIEQAVIAVLASWESPRARTYRALHAIPDDLGTAVVVQAMVFGNRDGHSAAGVAFSRDPITGAPEPYGDVLFSAQGDDVVAGRHTPRRLAELATRMPRVWARLRDALSQLEAELADLCHVEFTIESGELWFLQVRRGGGTDRAAIRIAVDLADHGLISRVEAVRRIHPLQAQRAADPQRHGEGRPLTTGLGASPGIATGRLATTADDAVRLARDGPVILVRPETSPFDVHGIAAAAGLVSSRGGITSHAAVVARSLAKPAVVGAEALQIDPAAGTATIEGTVMQTGDVLSIDGTSGTVMAGESHAATAAVHHPDHLDRLLRWADDVSGVRHPGPAHERVAAAHAVLQSS